MSDRKPSAYINDVLKCIKHIGNYTSNLSLCDLYCFSKIRN